MLYTYQLTIGDLLLSLEAFGDEDARRVARAAVRLRIDDLNLDGPVTLSRAKITVERGTCYTFAIQAAREQAAGLSRSPRRH